MVFKKVSLEYAQFDIGNEEDIKQMVEDNCQKYDGPMGDMPISGQCKVKSEFKNPSMPLQKAKGGKRREQNFVVRDLITALALCHNVTPVYPDENDKSKRDF
jgi:phospholipid-translocating ATPase